MSGLAAIRALTRAGHGVTCYEAGSTIGGMWRYANDNGLSAAYASLHANTSRRRMQYPSLPMPDSVAEFPHRSDILAYLEAYAEENDLRRRITCGAWVEAARAMDGAWEVALRGGSSRRFDALVVASGHYWDPAIPELPGEFEGTITHAHDYRTPDRFEGKRVVVVGGAQSALDIVAEITTAAERTILSCGQVHHLIPHRILGRPYDDFDNEMALLVPLPMVRLAMRALMWVARATPSRGSLPAPRHRLFETRWPAVVSPAAEAAVAARAFESRPRVSALAGERVVFSDGSREPVDAIVFATGYRINFPFLPERLGRGKGWEFPLYRRILSPHVPGLAFIGVLEPGPGLFEIVERQSAWLAEALAGRLPVPDRGRMWKAIDAGGERRSRRQFAATGPHTILCNRHAYLRLLARDLRRASRRSPATHRPQSPGAWY
jgi:dimethylaniline monooxygenase (N-oxide forming)